MNVFSKLWCGVANELFGGADDQAADRIRNQARATAPVIWMLGKAGAGKTSIIAALTAESRAEVGNGYVACTKTASFYDFPSEAPLVRFLDTRGLGEAGYEASEDIAWCESQAHLVLAVARVADPEQRSILDVLRRLRSRHPSWPVIVAQTGLHDCYFVGKLHPEPYPFAGGHEDDSRFDLPDALGRAIAHQCGLFADISGDTPRFVPIDFTLPEDGYEPTDYGIDALLRAIGEAGPEAHEALRDGLMRANSDRLRARSRPLILSCATVAGGAGAVPVPLVGIGGLAALVAFMLRTLAKRYGTAWTPAMFTQFSAAIGGGALLAFACRYGVRELLKAIPILGTWVGGTLNAAAAFAVTVGLGEAACVWLGYVRRDQEPEAEHVRRAFAAGLADGFRRRKRARDRGGR